jgi:putative PIN family toxin of toxin-antitoxin system
MPMPVVLDTNILVSTILSPQGNPAKVFHLAQIGRLQIHYTESVMDEYETVLSRSKFPFSKRDVELTLADVKRHGAFVEPADPSDFPMIDETDRKFHDLALKADAYLVTGNKKHFPIENWILTPSEFLEKVVVA